MTIDGSFSYAEHVNDAKDNGRSFSFFLKIMDTILIQAPLPFMCITI